MVALGMIFSLFSLNVAADPNPGSLSFSSLYFNPTPCLGVAANFNVWINGNGSTFQYHYDFGDLNSLTNPSTDILDSAFHNYQAIGTYQVLIQVTNELNDTLDTLVSITILPSPVVQIVSQSQDSVICDGEAIVFEPGGDPVPNYYWNSPYATSSTYSVYFPGTYYLTGVASNGCSGWDSIVVTAGPTPAALNYQTVYPFCAGDQIQITPSSYDNTLNYSWNPSSDISDVNVYNPIITPSGQAQTYIVGANNGGCSVFDTLYFTSTNFSNVIPQNSPAYLCGTAQVNLITSVGFVTYLWSNSSTIQNIQVSTPGAYSVIVSDSYGCLGYDTVQVLTGIVPSPLDYPDTINYCPFNSVQIFPNTPDVSLTYAWNPPIGFDDPTTIAPTYSGMANQVFVVVGSNGECAVTDSVLLLERDFSDAIFGEFNASFCSGTNYPITGNPGYASYTWSSGQTTQQILTSDPGIYFLYVTDQAGCSGVDSVYLTQTISPQIDTVLQSSTCPGSTALLYAGVTSGTAPIIYSWSNGFFMDTISVVVEPNPGQYSLQVSDANGCGSNNYIHTMIIDAAACDSVWPGENNGDFIVNNLDLFNIGTFYGQTFSARPTQSIAWAAQYAGFSFPAANYPSVDMKHSDSNGDGTIDAQDTLAIVQNYGLVEGKTEWENNQAAELLMRIRNPYTSVVEGGQALNLPVSLGDNLNFASNLYSVGFTINYNPEQIVPNSLGFRFNSGFIGTDMVDQISIRKVDYNNGRIYVAATRINQQPVSTYGDIGEVYCITVENLSGKTEETVSQYVPFTLSDVVLMDNLRQPISVQVQSDSVLVDFQTGIESAFWGGVTIFPNPFNNQIDIQLGKMNGKVKITLTCIDGKFLQQKQFESKANEGVVSFERLENLEPGFYFLTFTDDSFRTKTYKVSKYK